MSKYAFFLGQNGGGSDGDFAIIKIDYPDGTQVYVEHEGEVIEAPSTKGPWMFGCDEVGLYKIGIDGTDISQEIEITFKGQIESTFVSPQIINYALIYHLGNEFANPSEDELRYSIKTGGWVGGTHGGDAETKTSYFLTNYDVNNAGYIGAFLKARVNTEYPSSDSYQPFLMIALGDSVNGNFGVFSNQYVSFSQSFVGNNTYNVFSMGNISTKSVRVGVGLLTRHIRDPKPYNPSFSKQPNRLVSTIYFGGEKNALFYSMGFYKQDNISVLSAYGSTISAILNNATALFQDSSALTRMVLNCTGDFMISALSNTNFVNAMNLSPNKIILTANEHWARFIALLSV